MDEGDKGLPNGQNALIKRVSPCELSCTLMPMVATGLREAAILMRTVRSSLLEVMDADYVRTAYTKGLKEL